MDSSSTSSRNANSGLSSYAVEFLNTSADYLGLDRPWVSRKSLQLEHVLLALGKSAAQTSQDGRYIK